MPLPAVASLVRGRTVENRLVRHQLQIEVERCVHAQSRAMHLFGSVLLLELPPHLLHEVRRNRVRRRLDVQSQRSRLGRFLLLAGNLAVGQHLAQHEVASPQCPLRKLDRGIILRALGQSCQQRRLRQRQIARMLAEVVFRRRLEPIRPVSQVDLVRVHLEDLVLGEHPLNLHREQDLLDLPPIGLLIGEKQISRQLHGQRRRALRPTARMQVAPRRTHGAHQVHAPVALERLVLD